jgi:undecaprenyl-phosphate 4-deoxy-4-formamido-L-arabinose transferase
LPQLAPSGLISVVVPVFGDGGDLEDLARRLSEVFGSGRAWELILVNDGSPRATWETIERLAGMCPTIRGVNLLRNFGQHNALLAGIRASAGDVIVTMDDDLQHPPEEIPRLLERLESADLVYGTPIGLVRGRGRAVAAAVSKAALASVLGAEHARDIAAFRAFHGTLRKVFSDFDGPNVSIDVLLSWATTRVAAVPVRYEPRQRGRSGYGVRPLLRLTLNMVTGFSVWPLRLASIVGIGCAGFGGLVLIFVILRYLTAGTTVPGFAFLASVIAIFAGAQLFSLGIMGEYLARMYFRTLNRPAYIVESTANLDLPGRSA